MQHIVYIEDNEINATVFKHLMSPLYPVRIYQSGESYFEEVGHECARAVPKVAFTAYAFD